jgi:hypothetical protein
MINRSECLRLLLCAVPVCIAFECSSNTSSSPSTWDTHTSISRITEGMTEQDVRKVLGPPDEVRTIDEEHLLDGARVYSSRNTENGETYRWAYGPRQPGTFARTGIVSFDQKKQVVWAQSPILQHGLSGPPAYSKPKGPIISSDGLSCRIDGITFEDARGETVRSWSARVTLKNGGPRDYSRKSTITASIQRLSTMEVYDSEKVLVSRDDHRVYGSPFLEPQILSLPAGHSRTEQVNFSTDEYFGPLPAGRYFLRVCFAYTDTAFISSSLTPFMVSEFAEDSEYWEGFRTKASSVRGKPRR